MSLTVIQSEYPPDRVAPPDNISLAEWMVSISDAIVIARVTSRTSHLTTVRDWVETDVRSVITDVLKTPPRVQLRLGDVLTMIEDGGDLQTGGTLIKARVPHQMPMHQGGVYLLFFNITDPDRPTALSGAPAAYELANAGRFIRLFNDDDVKNNPDEIENVLSSQAIADIREAASAAK